MKLLPWLDANVGITILVGTILLVSSVAYVATKDANIPLPTTRAIDLAAGDYRATLSLSRPSDKPSIVAADERHVLDTSAWESVVSVNGSQRRLYELEYNVATQANVAYVTWSGVDHAIEERIQTSTDGIEIRWSWLRAPAAGPQEVAVELGQFAYFLENASYRDGAIRYRLAPHDPRLPIPPLQRDETRPLDVAIQMSGATDAVWFGQTSAGIDGFRVRSLIHDPPAGEPVVFLTQRVTYARSDGGPPPPDGPRPTRATPLADDAARSILLATANYSAAVTLFDGAKKPVLRTSDGLDLVELSGWESQLRVNGTVSELYRHAFNVSSNGTAAQVTWFDLGYSLNESIELHDDGLVVSWWWYRSPEASRQIVDLAIAHFAPNMTDPTRDGDRAEYAIADGRVRIDVASPVAITLGVQDGRPDSVRTHHHLEDPPAGAAVLLASERVSYARGASPPTRSSAFDAPLPDPGARAIFLAAGRQRTSIPLDTGTAKPLLGTDDGRALLEVSGWESTLNVSGAASPLQAALFHVDGSGADPCLVWSTTAYALRECVTTSAQDWRLAWSWWRAPDAPAQDVDLTVAHFAYVLHDAGINRTHVDYRLDAVDPRQGAGQGAPSYLVHVQLDREPTWTDFAPDAIRLRFALHDPPAGAWTPVASERVFFDRGPPS